MTDSISGPAYRIITPRLVIRCWQPRDAALLKEAVDASKEHLIRFMPWAQNEPTSLEEKIAKMRSFRGHFDLGQDYIYGIFNPDETRVLGGTGLHLRSGTDVREIGYWIHKDFIRQGLATETSAALTRVAFEVDGVRRVEIHMVVENVASMAVPRKLGFTHEATLRQHSLLADGLYHDSMIWSIFRGEYLASPCAHAQVEAYDAFNRRLL